MFSSTKIMQALSPAAASPTDYQIARSLRFNSADSAYLTRTPASAGNRKTFTISTWCKRSTIEDTGSIINARSGSPWSALSFSSGDSVGGSSSLSFTVTAGVSPGVYTTGIFRDPCAWYHIVCAVDTTQSTASNRVKIYINNVQQTLLSGNYPTLNQDSDINNTVAHQIGNPTAYTNASNFYLAEFYLIDGQALTPTSFGETNSATGVWMPKQVTGMTYGTNGFYLNFSDNSGVTATTLGKDSSGNSNNWTPNNFSVTAGVGNDSLVDSPTNYGTDTGVGGEVRGNYCTWNSTSPSGATFTNGNLDVTVANNGLATPSTIFPSSGKWYCEVLWVSGSSPRVGITTQAGLSDNLGNTANSWANLLDGRLYHNASVTSYGVSLAAGDVLIMALDLDAGKLWYGKNGTWMSSGDPATGANPSQTFTANQAMSFAVSSGGGVPAFTVNFGQRPFAYTAPSGFKALTTTNLPTPAIGATSSTLASKNMNAVLYTGNGSTLNVTGVGFQPDLVWTKVRSTTGIHGLFDSVRGATKVLSSDSTAAENTLSGVTAFNADGFSLGADWNLNAGTYVGWTWKGGGTAVTNTAGTISSQVSANPTAGIAVVTYSGNGTAGATVGHGLGVAPAMVIVKSRTISPSAWRSYNKNLANAATTLDLNSDAAADGTNASSFNSTAPTSSVFSLGTSDSTNNSSATYVAYCFAEVIGFSKIGSYVGNGSADGTFIYTGFRPRYIMIKGTNTNHWSVKDTARSPSNVALANLFPNLNNAETSEYDYDILSNGFKIRTTSGTVNTSGQAYIFMAFAESPFNYSRAR